MQLSFQKSQNAPRIKSWFGFILGAVLIGVSILALFESFTLDRVLTTLAFLCFWYPWSQTTNWNIFNKNNKANMSQSCTYLSMTAMVLIMISTMIRFY